MDLEKLARDLGEQWAVIHGSLYIFLLAILLVAGVLAKAFSLWHRREKENLRSTIQTKEAELRLSEREKSLIREEADGLRKKLEETTSKPGLSFSISGSPKLLETFSEMMRAAPSPLTVRNRPPELTEQELDKLAAFHRLRELNLMTLAKGDEMTTTGTSTSAAIMLAPLIRTDPLKPDKKS
jgi:ABC-type transport system involved in cytochrome c biogenesis permease subunit